MVAIIIGIVTMAIVFAIGAIAIGREARRLDAFSPVPTLDVEEVVDWIGEHLPPAMSAELGYLDVRRILDWQLDELERRGLASESIVVHGPAGRVVTDLTVVDDEMVDTLVQRAITADDPYTGAQIRAVLEAYLGYLAMIGAVGPVAGDEAS
jgi:hypothetical protein